MQKTCKQCGKTFTLTQSEIDFYEEKNLSIPKRCKECRAQNRQQTDSGGQPGYTSSGTDFKNHRGNRSLISKIGGFLIAAALMVLAATQVVPTFLGTDSADSGYTASSSNSADSGYTASSSYSFRSEKLLSEHYSKHGIEMGFASAKEYEAGAIAVIENAAALHKVESEDGDVVYYLKSTNEFVVVSTDGYIRTYFKPDDGIAYYNRQ
jgi:hypothetical protein